MTRPDRARAGARAATWLAPALAAAVLASCLPPPQRMCTAASDCGGGSAACVAGRCIAGGAVPAISTARRVVYEPVDVAYVRRGGEGFARAGGAPAPAAFATFGLAS